MTCEAIYTKPTADYPKLHHVSLVFQGPPPYYVAISTDGPKKQLTHTVSDSTIIGEKYAIYCHRPPKHIPKLHHISIVFQYPPPYYVGLGTSQGEVETRAFTGK